jgi:hypothetical protein
MNRSLVCLRCQDTNFKLHVIDGEDSFTIICSTCHREVDLRKLQRVLAGHTPGVRRPEETVVHRRIKPSE